MAKARGKLGTLHPALEGRQKNALPRKILHRYRGFINLVSLPGVCAPGSVFLPFRDRSKLSTHRA